MPNSWRARLFDGLRAFFQLKHLGIENAIALQQAFVFGVLGRQFAGSGLLPAQSCHYPPIGRYCRPASNKSKTRNNQLGLRIEYRVSSEKRPPYKTFAATDSTKPGRPRLVLDRHQISVELHTLVIFPTQSCRLFTIY